MKSRIIITSLLLMFLGGSVSNILALNTKSNHATELQGKKNFKRVKAYFRYRDEDYNGALRIYRDIYKGNEKDAKLNLMIGKCNLMLQNMDQALLYLKIARKIDPSVNKDLPFYMGQAYQYLGKLDSAIIEYKTYTTSLSVAQLKNNPVVELLSQAVTAKEQMEHPVDVTIKNLGSDINSEFDDGIPSVTADGKTLIFTSRRPDTKGSGIDPNTGLYYDDIYMATWNTEKGTWNPAEGVEGDLNTAGHDACTSISPDGNTIFVYRNIPKVTGSGDIYYSTKKTDGRWSNPKSIGKPVNSTFFESSACISPDGNTLYFVSERNGGYGNADIWKSIKIGKNLWSKPENLGNVVNTEDDELGVFIHPDGKTLFFSSKGHKTMGGYDIFMTQMKPDSSWSVPVNLGYPINTTKNDNFFVMTADGKTAYITSNKDGGLGGADLYVINMSKYKFPLKIEGQENVTAVVESKISILKGSVLESSAAQKVDANVIIKDPVSGKVITTIQTNEAGDYFVTLTGDKEYEIIINKEGYKPYDEKIMLPAEANKTYSLVKLIVLEKLPEEKK
jgi:Tol biopolymer transport system component